MFSFQVKTLEKSRQIQEKKEILTFIKKYSIILKKDIHVDRVNARPWICINIPPYYYNIILYKNKIAIYYPSKNIKTEFLRLAPYLLID